MGDVTCPSAAGRPGLAVRGKAAGGGGGGSRGVTPVRRQAVQQILPGLNPTQKIHLPEIQSRSKPCCDVGNFAKGVHITAHHGKARCAP